jgi:hypothetical protein
MSKIRYVAVPDVRAKAVTSSQITASSAETGREDDEEREKEKDAPARPRDDDFAALLRELPASAARIARAPIAPVTELAAHVMNEKRPRALVDRARLDALLNDDLAPPPPRALGCLGRLLRQTSRASHDRDKGWLHPCSSRC